MSEWSTSTLCGAKDADPERWVAHECERPARHGPHPGAHRCDCGYEWAGDAPAPSAPRPPLRDAGRREPLPVWADILIGILVGLICVVIVIVGITY